MLKWALHAVIGNCGITAGPRDLEYFIENHGNPVTYMSYIGHNFFVTKSETAIR
jgi:hypothetical protein